MKALFTLSVFFFPFILLAQPSNDDCPPTDLGVAPYCPSAIFFSNVDATTSAIGMNNQPDCWAGTEPERDVWFVFTASDTIADYTITVNGMDDGSTPAITQPQIAIYRGICAPNTLFLLKCDVADPGENILETNLLDLDPGERYFIRINDAGSPGAFKLCVDKIEPIFTIDDPGSTTCTGQLFDSGGANGDYSSSENQTFSICPPFPDNQCITFNLMYYNIDPSDVLTFYDGMDATGTVIGQISGGSTIEGGGVCYSVQASSGCLTVAFSSDQTVNFEGFSGFWQCSSAPCGQTLPFDTDPDASEQEIVDILGSSQATVSIDRIICPDGALGTFLAGDNTDLGLDQGLLLTSGSVFNAVGPNADPGATVDHYADGDEDLDYLSTIFGDDFSSQDACVIELDVFVNTNELSFEYIFGSEEYPEWVNQGFNDIFAFLISGPGITGDPNIDNQENIAVLPQSNTPIQINSVNNLTNWEYYRDNQESTTLQYDGHTSDFQGIKKSLTAKRIVEPCNSYRLKLAIADRGDGQFDSGVFIGKLQGGAPQLEVQFASGIDYFIEGCSGVEDVLVLSLTSPSNED
ncbi:MAG: choice-of-anchor L domain-containing protein, partial [Bacteroidota bacterium]